MLDFALCPPDQPLRQSIEARQREWAGACYSDYGFHLMLRGTQTPELLGALPEAVQAGHATAKIFTTDIRPLNQGRMVKFGDIWEVLKIMAREGGLDDDPRRGQRHRHAHVRKAVPRGADRLREHGRGA